MMKVTSKAGVNTCRVHRFTLPNLFLLPEPVAHWMVISVNRNSTHKYIVKEIKRVNTQLISLAGWFVDEGTKSVLT